MPIVLQRGLCRVGIRCAGVLVGVLVLASGYGPSGQASSTRPTMARVPSPSPANSAPSWARPLAGAVVVLDPGHDGGNGRHPGLINRLVDTPLGPRPCDTAGTETNAGYPEHVFTWDLAQRLAGLLTEAGARVVLTRTSDDGVGPCTVDRARIGNGAAADAGNGVPVVALSLHADGGPSSGVGFHVIEPGPAGPNDAIVEPSRRLGTAIRDAFHADTGEPYASYLGTQGVTVRTDLGGLNLSTVPKVFLECGNMRNAQDATRLVDPGWRERAARALERGLAVYLGT